MGRGRWWWLFLVMACGRPQEAPPVSATVEDVLWGGADCRRSRECATGVCTGGTCVGYLGASTEEARETIGPVLAALALQRGEEVRDALSEVLASAGSDEFIRGRAADAFRWLPLALGAGVLSSMAGDPSEPVRFFAARARHLRGDPEAGPLLRVFLQHPSEAVRMLAARALEPRRSPGGQGPINQ